MDSASLDKAVCILPHTNAIEKGMNLAFLIATVEWWSRLDYLGLARQYI